MQYRIATETDRDQAEALVARSFGAAAVLPRDSSMMAVAVTEDGTVVGSLYLSVLTRVDALCIDRRAKEHVSLGGLTWAIDSYLISRMWEMGIKESQYFSFLADPSKADRLK